MWGPKARAWAEAACKGDVWQYTPALEPVEALDAGGSGTRWRKLGCSVGAAAVLPHCCVMVASGRSTVSSEGAASLHGLVQRLRRQVAASDQEHGADGAALRRRGYRATMTLPVLLLPSPPRAACACA